MQPPLLLPVWFRPTFTSFSKTVMRVPENSLANLSAVPTMPLPMMMHRLHTVFEEMLWQPHCCSQAKSLTLSVTGKATDKVEAGSADLWRLVEALCLRECIG
jgi:hypothetical protein